jgi:hypothetical protein
MSIVVIVVTYAIMLSLSLAVMYWLFKRYEGKKLSIIITALLATSVFITLALFYFIIYAATVLVVVLMARWLMAEWENPKYGGIILSLYLGFFLSFPVGVYQYAN